ncbi:MAG: CARDB domain-containing protein, partial [Candidatus Parabeggiatoa sp.]|nr:CARDB domain-containing protein [Candidatus Parabeggiatoa sp.]
AITSAAFVRDMVIGAGIGVATGGMSVAAAATGTNIGYLFRWGLSVLGLTVGMVKGPALLDLNPQSSALIALNGNKKDEGYEGHEPDDNISTVYGSKVPYFSIYSWFGIPGPTHYHVTESIVLPWWSFYTDLIVHEDSSKLDNVIYYRSGHEMHTGLTENDDALEKAIEYLGDSTDKVKRKTRQAQRQTREKVNMADALAGHVLYAPDNGEFATISAGESIEQAFEVDTSINNLHVMVMGLVTENSIKPYLYLVSPSGKVIDENTTLSNVVYDNANPNGVTYHISDAESGTWKAIIKSTSNQSTQYVLLVTGETDFWVGIEEGSQVEPGEPFKIVTYAQKGGSPIADLEVNAILLKTLDQGERIGKYGSELHNPEPVAVALSDIGNGRYELLYEDTVAPGAYRVFITATDPATETSRVAFTTFFVEYDYELAVQSEDISFSNDAPEHHETITLYGNIHNESSIEVKEVEVWFADGSLSKGGTVFAKETLEHIPAGGSTLISASWLATAGTHDIVVMVSPMNTFIETNQDNNMASKTIIVVDNPPIAYAGIDQNAR